MDKKKTFLYVSAGLVWILIVLCTLVQDHKYSDDAGFAQISAPKTISLNENASMVYGPLATGDTQVTLKYGKKEVNAVIPKKSEDVVCRAVFPAGEKHVGVSVKNDTQLDTVILFDDREAQVFYHVIAMDSDTGRIACLVPSETEELDLVISTFEKTVIKTVRLKNHSVSFLQTPKIESAVFIGSEFKLDTAFGTFRVPLPSLI